MAISSKSILSRSSSDALALCRSSYPVISKLIPIFANDVHASSSSALYYHKVLKHISSSSAVAPPLRRSTRFAASNKLVPILSNYFHASSPGSPNQFNSRFKETETLQWKSGFIGKKEQTTTSQEECIIEVFVDDYYSLERLGRYFGYGFCLWFVLTGAGGFYQWLVK